MVLSMTLLVGCADDPVHPAPLDIVGPVTDDTGTQVTDDSDTTDSTPPDTGPDRDLDDDGYPEPEDCDDADATIHPDAPDNCHDDIDQDCVDGPLDCGPVPDVVVDDADTTIFSEWDSSYEYDSIGAAVASLGDLDGDGDSEFATLGDYHMLDFAPGPTPFKQVWIFDGPIDEGDVLADDAAIATTSGDVGDPETVYWSIAAAGDANADGYADLLLGAASSCSKVFTFLGPLSGELWRDDADAVWGCGHAGIGPGFTVDADFDFDGDGFDDAVIGSPWATFAGFDTGAVYLIQGPVQSLSVDEAEARLDGTATDLGRGWAAPASLGDVDGDGLDDFATGAYAGPVFVYTGGALSGELASDDAAYAYYENPTAQAYIAPVDGGDFNADGYADLLVWGFQTVEGYDGIAFMVAGPMKESGGVDTLALTTFIRDGVSTWASDGSADVNGDGSTDVLIGATIYSDTKEDMAAEYLFYGPLTGAVDASDARCRMFEGTDRVVAFSTGRFIGDQYGDGAPEVVLGRSRDGGQLWVVSSEHL